MTEIQANIAVKSGLWYTVGNFSTKAIGFITTPIFTRLLTPEEVGDYSNVVSWIEIFIIVCTFNLFSSVMTAKFDFKDEIDDYIASNLIAGSLVTVFFLWDIYLLPSNNIGSYMSFFVADSGGICLYDSLSSVADVFN